MFYFNLGKTMGTIDAGGGGGVVATKIFIEENCITLNMHFVM